jgi:hypothetical protein
MKHFVAHLSGVVAVFLATASVSAERTVTNRSLHEFWAQFKDGDTSASFL